MSRIAFLHKISHAQLGTFTRPLASKLYLRRQFSTSMTHFKKTPDSYYVTTPIFYVNAEPHIGHLYSMVLADTLKRYQELLGKTVQFSTGTDEHGLKIQQAAEKAGEETLQFCTRFSTRFRDLASAAAISSTDYIRTTEPRHYKAVNAFWKRLVDRGFIYKGEHSGWYAVSDEAFYTENQIEERVVDEKTGKKGMFAIESGQPVEWTSEVNYKFRLSEFTNQIIEWIESTPNAIYPDNRCNEVLKWLYSGVDDISVSRPRSRLHWGIPVPGDSDHTIYVWVDALVNYATVCGYPWGSTDPSFFPADTHVVGKDIVRFHAVYWPALLLAAGYPLPKRILAHAHWTMGGQKMSKSKGNVADPFEIIDKYGVDPIRYYMIRSGGIADDGDYSTEELVVKYKKELVGKLANLASRCLSDSLGADLNKFAAIGREQLENVTDNDTKLRDLLINMPSIVKKSFDLCEFGHGLRYIFDSLVAANRYITRNEPWNIVKQDGDEAKARLQVVLFYSLEATRQASIMLQPIMPEKASQLLDHLAIDHDERQWEHAQFGHGWQTKGPKLPLRGVHALFPKLD